MKIDGESWKHTFYEFASVNLTRCDLEGDDMVLRQTSQL